jgi:hypothetical protein
MNKGTIIIREEPLLIDLNYKTLLEYYKTIKSFNVFDSALNKIYYKKLTIL